MSEKVCKVCGESKPIEDFQYKRREGKGRRTREKCPDCLRGSHQYENGIRQSEGIPCPGALPEYSFYLPIN